MRAYDFEYDGLKLSSFGYMICNFGSGGMQTISIGSQITFNTVATMNGSKHSLTSNEYKECLKSTIQICKSGCNSKNYEIPSDELRMLSRWLNRSGFHKFKILNTEYIDVYFEASFNISQLEFHGATYGLELEVITNRPFALQEPRTKTITHQESDEIHMIKDYSDVEGFIYPKTEITLSADGLLEITNQFENRVTAIKNCTAGEVITLDYPTIYTSKSDHKIQNDFNWNFFRLANTFKNSGNKISISLPCVMKLSYSAPIRLGL